MRVIASPSLNMNVFTVSASTYSIWTLLIPKSLGRYSCFFLGYFQYYQVQWNKGDWMPWCQSFHSYASLASLFLGNFISWNCHWQKELWWWRQWQWLNQDRGWPHWQWWRRAPCFPSISTLEIFGPEIYSVDFDLVVAVLVFSIWLFYPL